MDPIYDPLCRCVDTNALHQIKDEENSSYLIKSKKNYSFRHLFIRRSKGFSYIPYCQYLFF